MYIQFFIFFNYAPLLGLVYCLQAHSTAFNNITSPVPLTVGAMLKGSNVTHLSACSGMIARTQ